MNPAELERTRGMWRRSSWRLNELVWEVNSVDVETIGELVFRNWLNMGRKRAMAIRPIKRVM